MFATDALVKLGEGYSHPAYTDPTLPTAVTREVFKHSERYAKDPMKGVQRIYDLSLLPEPPLRFPLGLEVVDAVAKQIKSVENDVAKYASWSEGLEFDRN